MQTRTTIKTRTAPNPPLGGPEHRGLRRSGTSRRVARLLGGAAATAIAASGALSSTASGLPNEPNKNETGEAIAEVCVQPAEWKPVQGACDGSLETATVEWAEVKERGDVGRVEGQGARGMSLEQLGRLIGVPRGQLTEISVGARDRPGVDTLSSNEVGGASEPYLEAEGAEGGTSAISFVEPQRGADTVRVAGGPGAEEAVQVVFVIEGELLHLGGLKFSPTEPSAGTTVEFTAPHPRGDLEELHYTYKWLFGDGTESSEEAPKHTYAPAAKNGTNEYEVSVEVTASHNGREVLAGTVATTVPVKTTTAANAPAQQTPVPTGAAATAPPVEPPGATAPTAKPPSGQNAGQTGVGHNQSNVGRAPRTPADTTPAQGSHSRAGRHRANHGHGGGSSRTSNPEANGGGYVYRSPGETGVGTRVVPENSGSKGAQDTHPTLPRGRAPQPPEKAIPALPRPQPGLQGVLLESLGQAPLAATPAAPAASPTVQALRGLRRPPASVTPLGALGLALGILGVLLVVLSGAVSELRVGRFVR
jgi:PKD domain